jgi:hypothetical protein
MGHELTFAVNREDGVMYDAFRLEVSNTGANPATTGWDDYEFLYNSTDTLVNDAVAANDGNPSQIIPEPASALAMIAFLSVLIARRPTKRNSFCGGI